LKLRDFDEPQIIVMRISGRTVYAGRGSVSARSSPHVLRNGPRWSSSPAPKSTDQGYLLDIP